jgi:prepilin-type N-terminal cleavage/methylation domain-containing protein
MVSHVFHAGMRCWRRACRERGFSFVEVLAAIAIIGIITFLAIPNLVQIRQDGEDGVAIARAEALNLAMASYVNAKGTDAAWSSNANTAYGYVKAYLAFAPSSITNYMPSGYSVTFPSSLSSNLSKVGLTGPNGAVYGYSTN